MRKYVFIFLGFILNTSLSAQAATIYFIQRGLERNCILETKEGIKYALDIPGGESIIRYKIPAGKYKVLNPQNGNQVKSFDNDKLNLILELEPNGIYDLFVLSDIGQCQKITKLFPKDKDQLVEIWRFGSSEPVIGEGKSGLKLTELLRPYFFKPGKYRIYLKGTPLVDDFNEPQFSQFDKNTAYALKDDGKYSPIETIDLSGLK